MNMKPFRTMILLCLVLSMAACSTTKKTTSATSAWSKSSSKATASVTTETSLQEKLAAGTLSLEGTDNAVTAEQAKELLPLWKAVKVLDSSDTISNDEKQALYDQIQETMTASQIQAITQMSMTIKEATSLATKLGIDLSSASSTGSTTTEEERAAQIKAAQSSSSSSSSSGRSFAGGRGGFPGGGFPGGGMPSGGMPSGAEMMGAPGAAGSAQSTPAAGRVPGGDGQGMAFNTTNLFLDSLISMLKERAASVSS